MGETTENFSHWSGRIVMFFRKNSPRTAHWSLPLSQSTYWGFQTILSSY